VLYMQSPNVHRSSLWGLDSEDTTNSTASACEESSKQRADAAHTHAHAQKKSLGGPGVGASNISRLRSSDENLNMNMRERHGEEKGKPAAKPRMSVSRLKSSTALLGTAVRHLCACLCTLRRSSNLCRVFV
jgi:hypothetical protein